MGVPRLTADLSLLDDASTETLSTLEALNDIVDTVETIVLGFSGEQQRDAYLSRVEDYEDCAETLPDSTALRTPEQNARLSALGKLTEDAFEALLRGCPAHIRSLFDAVRTAMDAEASRT
jgi:hypothetical protein